MIIANQARARVKSAFNLARQSFAGSHSTETSSASWRSAAISIQASRFFQRWIFPHVGQMIENCIPPKDSNLIFSVTSPVGTDFPRVRQRIKMRGISRYGIEVFTCLNGRIKTEKSRQRIASQCCHAASWPPSPLLATFLPDIIQLAGAPPLPRRELESPL